MESWLGITSRFMRQRERERESDNIRDIERMRDIQQRNCKPTDHIDNYMHLNIIL